MSNLPAIINGAPYTPQPGDIITRRNPEGGTTPGLVVSVAGDWAEVYFPRQNAKYARTLGGRISYLSARAIRKAA